MSQTTISVTISFLGLLVSGGAFIFLVLQIKLLRVQVEHAKETYVAEQVISRQRATLEFLATTSESRFHFIASLPSLRDDNAVSEFLKEIQSDKDKERLLIAFLSCHAYIATGANMGIFDEEVVHRTIGATVEHAQRQFSSYIAGRRAREGNPNLYIELEKLAKTINGCVGHIAGL